MKSPYCPSSSPAREARRGFTLVEVLVSMTILVILLLVSAQVIGTVQSTWTASNARVGQFREARTAFDIITRNLSQATLNTYLDYDQSWLSKTGTVAATAPTKYLRKSDLRFVCGPTMDVLPNGGEADEMPGHAVFFQAPLGISHNPAYVGLDRLLCGRGYFVQYTSDEFFVPDILPSGLPRYRYRLMEFSPPAERNSIYSVLPVGGVPNSQDWYAEAGVPRTQDETTQDRNLTRPIADNIVALIISPQLENPAGNAGNVADNYRSFFAYDSAIDDDPSVTSQGNQHRLPPMVRVVLVAIDERTADRLSQGNRASTPPLGNAISSLIGGGDAEVNLTSTLDEISEVLSKRRINFRIFSATVPIRGAKWSSN